MNNRTEQDHRRIRCRIRPMLGFKSERTAAIILEGIELVHRIRKRQMTPANDARNPPLAGQFDSLAAQITMSKSQIRANTKFATEPIRFTLSD